jgi:hypothetical protein
VKRTVILLLLFAALVAAAQTASGPSPHPTRKGDEQLLQQEAFTPAIADILVARIGEGLAGHNRKTLLSAFDKTDSQDYAAIKEQVNTIMEAYRTFRVHYRVESSALNADATATIHASFQIEQQPAADDTLAFRREATPTFIAKHTSLGWRVVSFSPTYFFIATE